MKNTLYEGYQGSRLPQEVQLERLRRVITEELTELQQEALVGYYFRNESLSEIAARRGVNRSTVCRTLHRAEQKLRRFLKY